MATFKVRVRNDQKRSDGTFKVIVRVIHNRTDANMKNMWYVTSSDLKKDGTIKKGQLKYTIEKFIIKQNDICNNNYDIISGLNAKQLVEWLEKYDRGKNEVWDLDFISYCDSKIEELKKKGSIGTAIVRQTALNSFKKYIKKDSISINDITTRLLNGWMKWIMDQPALGDRKKGNRAPSKYKQNLQYIYKQAMDEYNDEDVDDVKIPRNPFIKVEVPKWDAPKKRALTLKELRAILNVPYEKEVKNVNSRFNMAKDLFTMSFFLCGMNAVDFFYCTNIKGNKITYERTKTRTRRSDHAEITLTIPKEIKPLVEKYGGGSVGRVFRFSKNYSSTGNFNHAIEKGMKQIGDKIGIKNLQFYSARHTWATLAVNEVGIDKYTVHQALNHVDDKLSVTDIYIKKDWKVVDKANRKVINYVLKKKSPSSQKGKSSTTKNKK